MLVTFTYQQMGFGSSPTHSFIHPVFIEQLRAQVLDIWLDSGDTGVSTGPCHHGAFIMV